MKAENIFRLDGQVALVTGASGGLGSRFAQVAAANGASVMLVARRADRLNALKDKIENAGGDQKLCITEFGWPSTEDLSGSPEGFGFADDNTLEEQSEFTVAALDNMEEWGFVRLAFIWNLNYGPQAGWDPSNDNVPYSLIGPDTTFRPAFDAVREWLAEHHGAS